MSFQDAAGEAKFYSTSRVKPWAAPRLHSSFHSFNKICADALHTIRNGFSCSPEQSVHHHTSPAVTFTLLRTWGGSTSTGHYWGFDGVLAEALTVSWQCFEWTQTSLAFVSDFMLKTMSLKTIGTAKDSMDRSRHDQTAHFWVMLLQTKV